MADKWLPPLTVPLPKNHPCHYQNDFDYKLKHNYPSISNQHNSLILLMRKLGKKQNQSVEYGQADAFYRVFAKRSKDKEKKSQDKILYVLFDHRHEYIDVMDSIVQARRILSKDSVLVEKMGRKQRIDLKPGAYILKTINGKTPFSLFDYEPEDQKMSQVIATKKCKECPNQNSRRGICHCGFWSGLKDGTRPWQFISPHEITTRKRQKKKSKPKLIKLKIKI